MIYINLYSARPIKRIKVAGVIRGETTIVTAAVLRTIPGDVL